MNNQNANTNQAGAIASDNESYRNFFYNNHAVMLLIDPRQGRIVNVNDAACAFYGYPREEFIKLRMTDINPLPADQIQAKMELAKSTGSQRYFFRHKLCDGRLRDVEVCTGPVTVYGRKLLYSIVLDITEQKQTEQALRQLNETLEQQVAERTELAEARSRQLQRLAVELIEAEDRERSRVAELLHDDLQQILAAARFQLQAAAENLPPVPALANVEKLLEASMAKSRRLSHELSPPALHHTGLVAGLEWLVRQMDEQFGLHVELHADNARQIELESLKRFLFRAVQELLFNVVKHAGVKKVRVDLSVMSCNAVITVSDQGRGFNPDLLESSSSFEGFGLLSLRERTSHIGGKLGIQSTPGGGSRFTLTIPLSLTSTAECRAKVSGQQICESAKPADYASKRLIQVVLADDHKVMRQGLSRLISANPDFKVVGEAANGREAIECARKFKPDVVIMDISMPEMDGIEATRRIKTEMPGTRVIGLSMFEDEHIDQAMREAGAETFISKSASSAELLKAIHDIVRPA